MRRNIISMQTDTAALPAVRIPVDKPVRLVGISHSNNSKSLIDHASSAENIHEAAEIVSQNVAGILADAQVKLCLLIHLLEPFT